MANLYEVLNLDPSASVDDIRSAYRRLVKTVHPDMGGDPKEFFEVKNAYDILSDAKKKKRYDASLKLLGKRIKKERNTNNPTITTGYVYDNSGSYVPDNKNVYDQVIGDYWSNVSKSNVDAFGSSRTVRHCNVPKKSIIGGQIEQAVPSKVLGGLYTPPYNIRASIDVRLDASNDELKYLLPGDIVTINYSGSKIEMEFVSRSFVSHGPDVIIRLELEK